MISGWWASAGASDLADGRGVFAVVPTVQSAGFGSVPAGAPGTVQPSSVAVASKDVVPWPPGPAMSSTSTPPKLIDVSLA